MLESTPLVESFVKISVPMSFKLRKLKHFCGFVIALNLFSSKSVCTTLPFSAVPSIWFLIVKTFRRLESLAVQMYWTSLSAILFDIFVALQSSLIALYPTRSRVVFDRRGTAARVINKNLWYLNNLSLIKSPDLFSACAHNLNRIDQAAEAGYDGQVDGSKKNLKSFSHLKHFVWHKVGNKKRLDHSGKKGHKLTFRVSYNPFRDWIWGQTDKGPLNPKTRC